MARYSLFLLKVSLTRTNYNHHCLALHAASVFCQLLYLKGPADVSQLETERAWLTMCYHTKFRRYTSSRFGIHWGPKNFGNGGAPPLGMWALKYAPPVLLVLPCQIRLCRTVRAWWFTTKFWSLAFQGRSRSLEPMRIYRLYIRFLFRMRRSHTVFEIKGNLCKNFPTHTFNILMREFPFELCNGFWARKT